jgi:hypothetical protein
VALQTLPQFYYGHTVLGTVNASIDFDEGGPEIQATLNPGDYSLTTYAVEVARALNAAGSLTYTVSVNRTTGALTIAATGNFSLLFGTGTRLGTSAGPLMGFTAADTVAATSVTGSARSGFRFRPQALVDNHVSAQNFVEKTDAVVNESASGRVQVIQFGTTRFHEFEIRLSTSKTISNAVKQIEQNLTGEADLRQFMDYAITKAIMEFMPDRTVPGTFDTVLLERTPVSQRGTGYRLLEIRGGVGYFSTGTLRFRVVEV